MYPIKSVQSPCEQLGKTMRDYMNPIKSQTIHSWEAMAQPPEYSQITTPDSYPMSYFSNQNGVVEQPYWGRHQLHSTILLVKSGNGTLTITGNVSIHKNHHLLFLIIIQWKIFLPNHRVWMFCGNVLNK